MKTQQDIERYLKHQHLSHGFQCSLEIFASDEWKLDHMPALVYDMHASFPPLDFDERTVRAGTESFIEVLDRLPDNHPATTIACEGLAGLLWILDIQLPQGVKITSSKQFMTLAKEALK